MCLATKCATSDRTVQTVQTNSAAVKLSENSSQNSRIASFPPPPPPNFDFPSLLLAVRERCSFEGGETCGWTIMESSATDPHAFRWSPDQGESAHDLEQYHRPVNDHTL